MPTPNNLNSIEIEFSAGYFSSTPALAAEALQRSIRRGSNVWLRPLGGIVVADGPLQISTQNVGTRIFASDIQRASIAGGLISNRLPYAGFLRYANAALLFLSENTNAQVFLNEVAISGLTTSTTAGRLRVAIDNGVGGYNVFDAGFDKPQLFPGDISLVASAGVKGMSGFIGVAIVPWRSKTNAWGPPSDTQYNNIQPGTNTVIQLNTPGAVTGQDGWIIAGTRWGDQSGELQVIRYAYLTPRGTFTATNGSVNLSLGINTKFTVDLARGDFVAIDGGSYQIATINSDTLATLTTNFTGATGAGKTMFIDNFAVEYYDAELGMSITRDVFRPPRAAGVLQYAGRVFLWGIPDTAGIPTSLPTGNTIMPMLDSNPEHVGLLFIVTASGSDLVNVLAGDSPMYLMTTTDLEVVANTGNPEIPFIVRTIAEPGFKSSTNGAMYRDFFYGFNNRPLRTRADANIDVEFAQPVWSDMEFWDATRVVVAVDPENEAVLFCYDNGTSTVIIPFMPQLGVWGPPHNLPARLFDAQIVNGTLYVTLSNGANVRVNQWEGGTGTPGSEMYVASQYYDASLLNRNRLKNLKASGKINTISVFAALPGAAVPDVRNLGQAAAIFPFSNFDSLEPELFTNIHGNAFAFRVDFSDNSGRFEKMIARGTPIAERK